MTTSQDVGTGAELIQTMLHSANTGTLALTHIRSLVTRSYVSKSAPCGIQQYGGSPLCPSNTTQPPLSVSPSLLPIWTHPFIQPCVSVGQCGGLRQADLMLAYSCPCDCLCTLFLLSWHRACLCVYVCVRVCLCIMYVHHLGSLPGRAQINGHVSMPFFMRHLTIKKQ